MKLLHRKSTKNRCRLQWRPRLLAALLTLALVLSVAASLYCDFVTVTLGFVPDGYAGDKVGVALWSFQGPDGRCQSFQDAYNLGGFSNGDDNYSQWFANGDSAWMIARCAAIVGFVFGAIALVCILINLCGDEPHLVDVLAYTVIIALVSEAAKLGLFFFTDLCFSGNFWYSVELDEYMGSTSCGMSQGAFICIGSIALYFVPGVFLLAYNARPEIDGYNYDENSLQELTVAGKTTLSSQETSLLSSGQQSQLWKGSQFANVNSHHRRSSHISSNVGSSNSGKRQRSLYNEAEDEDEYYDAEQPLPEFGRPHRPNARRMMDDDVSAITMETNF